MDERPWIKVLLNKLLQLYAQGLVGAEEQRLGGGLAELEDVADLFVVHALVLVHEDGHALVFGQGEDVLADGVETLAAEQAVFGAGRTVGEVGVVPVWLSASSR